MTTRELIEAVRDVEAFMGAPSVNGVRTPCACIGAADYDALRAATRAVLDEVISAHDYNAPDRAIEIALYNASALLERLR